MPILRLPVRTEKSTMRDILGSFTEALDFYFVWLRGELHENCEPCEERVEAMLNAYWRASSSNDD